MSRARRFASGVTLGYASQAVVTLAGLWLTPFLLRGLGQHDYGLWLLGSQFLTYLMLADFGIVAVLPRETAYVTGRVGGAAPAIELPRLIGETARLVLWQVPAVATLAAGLWLSIPVEWAPLRGPISLVMATFVVTFPFRILQAVLQGLQDIAFVWATHIAAWLVTTAVTVVLVLHGVGIWALAVAWAIGHFLAIAFWWYRLEHRFPGVLPRRLPRLSRSVLRPRLISGFWMSVAQVAQVLLTGSDVMIIGAVLGPAVVVPFVCTAKLTAVLSNQPQLLMQAAVPALSELRVGADRERVVSVMTALTHAMLLVTGAVACLVLAINAGFVGWWVGTGLYLGPTMTAVLVLVMLLRHWNVTAIYAIFCFGRERRISVTNLCDGVLTIGAGLILSHVVGPLGVVLGSIAGVVAISLPANLTALSQETGASIGMLLKPLAPWCWRLTILAAAAFVVGIAWTPATFLGLALTVGGVMLVYLVVMLPPTLRSPLGSYFRPHFRRLREWLQRRDGRLFRKPAATTPGSDRHVSK